MDPLLLRTQCFTHGAGKSYHVVLRFSLDLFDPIDIEVSLLVECGHVVLGDDVDLGPCGTGGQFDVEPGLELLLLAPEGCHLWARIPIDHEQAGSR